jgi:hypothetical protein
MSIVAREPLPGPLMARRVRAQAGGNPPIAGQLPFRKRPLKRVSGLERSDEVAESGAFEIGIAEVH